VTGKGGVMEDHPQLIGATHNDEIRIAVGFRLYILFCADCNRTFMAEDERLQRLECPQCNRLYAYRMRPEEEKAIIELSMMEKESH